MNILVRLARERPDVVAPEALIAAGRVRAGGLVVNALLNGIAGALGWALGGLLPARDQ